MLNLKVGDKLWAPAFRRGRGVANTGYYPTRYTFVKEEARDGGLNVVTVQYGEGKHAVELFIYPEDVYSSKKACVDGIRKWGW